MALSASISLLPCTSRVSDSPNRTASTQTMSLRCIFVHSWRQTPRLALAITPSSSSVARAKKNADLFVKHLFEPLLSQLSRKDWRKVIVLRSGYCPERMPRLQIGAATDAGPLPVPTRPDTSTDEYASMCAAFELELKSRARHITYITLKENKFLKLQMQRSDIKPAVSGQTGLPALLLVKNPGSLGTDLQSIKITHVHSKHTNTGVIVASITNPPTAIVRIGTRNELWAAAAAAAATSNQTVQGKSLQPQTGTFRNSGGSTGFRASPSRGWILWDASGTAGLASPRPETPTKSSQREDTPSTPNARAQNAANGNNFEEASEIGDAAELSSQFHSLDLDEIKKEPENPLTPAEVQMMAELWDGKDLGLVGTKWPVLTHLAHLATKRVLLHLERDDWEGDKSDYNTTPFFLKPVHKNVRHSLYYF